MEFLVCLSLVYFSCDIITDMINFIKRKNK